MINKTARPTAAVPEDNHDLVSMSISLPDFEAEGFSKAIA
jgi:hypothetical protein